MSLAKPEPPKKNKPGLVCPLCQTHLHDVADTRKVASGIGRQRRCFNGHLFRTLEQLRHP